MRFQYHCSSYRGTVLARILVALVLVTAPLGFLDAAEGQILRHGVFIGANDGGKARAKLQWAEEDARRMAQVMQELGGLSGENTLFLSQPRTADIVGTLRSYRKKVTQRPDEAARVEFILYYSGHSNETGLLVGEEILVYSELRRLLEDIGADVTIAILDSCASGAFTRQKGGIRIQPFLIDQTSDMKGYAYLTSSSEDEASQESDALQASFFTHYMVSGLRGAADASGDNRVTLNEAYHYAFNQTLRRTEDSRAGPQHASYDIQLKGSGDLILSDLAIPNAGIVLSEGMEGKLFLRDAKGRLIAEVDKSPGTRLNLSVVPGTYTLRQEKGGAVLEALIQVHPNTQALVQGTQFVQRSSISYRTRGDEEPVEEVSALKASILHLIDQAELSAFSGQIVPEPEPDPEPRTDAVTTVLTGIPVAPLPDDHQGAPSSGEPDLELKILNISLVPGIGTVPLDIAYESVLTLSPTLAISHQSKGIAATGIGLINTGSLRGIAASHLFNIVGKTSEGLLAAGIFNLSQADSKGLHTAGLFNINTGTMTGVQLAGLFNINGGEFWGVQGGVFNLSGGKVHGVQIGVVNYADSMDGLPIGVFSWVRDGIHEFRVGFDGAAHSMEYSFANGTSRWYSRMGFALDFDRPFSDGGEVELEASDFGLYLGTRLGDKGLWVDIEGGVRFADIREDQSPEEIQVIPTASINLNLGMGPVILWCGPMVDILHESMARVDDYEARFADIPDRTTLDVGGDVDAYWYSRFAWGVSLRI